MNETMGEGKSSAKKNGDSSHRDSRQDIGVVHPTRTSHARKGNPGYRKGRRLEYRVLKLLREAGCMYPTRTAGSHGAYDVIAPFPEATYLISCKAYKGSKAEAERCQEASLHTSARWALVSLEDGKIVVQCWKRGKPWPIKPGGLGGK